MKPRRTSWGHVSLNIHIYLVLKGLAFSPAFEDFNSVTVAVVFFTIHIKKVGTESKGAKNSLHMESRCISGGGGCPVSSFKVERKYWGYLNNKVNLSIYFLFSKVIWDWCIETI